MFDNTRKECPNGEATCLNHSPPKKTESSPGVIESTSLFAGMKQVLISHAGEVYRLRITRNGKLILNK
jgi:hemin uptake protein HemP